MKYQIVKKEAARAERETFAEKPLWTLDEIALSPSTHEQIEEILAYVRQRDKLLDEWEFRRFLKTGKGLGVNFFGPSGTGKSIAAEAIANQLSMNIIKANYGELESELVGKTSKNIVWIFEKAEQTNSVLFFDEADAMLSKRITNVAQAADHGVNMTKSVLLTLLDKFNGVIIFATNFFENYDDAFLRRLLFNIEFPLPDLPMRIRLWELHLSPNVPKEISYARAAELSEGLSGGDIRNLTMKLGLKLLVGKVRTISEDVLIDAIEQYKRVRNRNRMINLAEVQVTEPCASVSQEQ